MLFLFNSPRSGPKMFSGTLQFLINVVLEASYGNRKLAISEGKVCASEN